MSTRSVLLGTTALLASSALAGTAGADEPIRIGVGGYFYGTFVVSDYDNDAGRRSRHLAREGEIHFTGETTLDNGLTVGVNVQLEAETCGDQIDESYIYLAGNWGRLNIGSENSAAYLMHVTAPMPIPGYGFDDPVFSPVGINFTTRGVDLTTDSEKVTYFSPRFAGLQLGASYTPDRCEEGGCGGTYSGSEFDDFSDGTIGDVVELGANYVRTYGDFKVAVSGSYGWGDAESGGPTRQDPREWTVGGNLGWKQFKLGAGYRQLDNRGGVSGADITEYTVGVSYERGPWTTGVAFVHRDTDGLDSADGVEVGASYALGLGVTVFGGVQYYDDVNGATAGGVSTDGDNLFGIVGTRLVF
ncbi:porin [Oceanibacterium hippocampi]|uniref:Porin domain-containing protein n=1 Tax=Oceanibacterium hippocampi TaxID=745714 RepID=A0A1Y5SBP2_9PROT|nr:porin [Oceanibacterium hippocampi]SLN37107.1 hypothetical protein OCH7691_01508 [Oceanibacterium hippocampi]